MLFGFEHARKGGGDGGFSITTWRDTCRFRKEVDEYKDEEFRKRTAKVRYAIDMSIGISDGGRYRWSVGTKVEDLRLT